MNFLPATSAQHYITGRAALNVPYPDGSFADWHFDEVFLSGKGKIRVAGKDTYDTAPILGNYGVRECSEVLRRFGVVLANSQVVYSANHIRAILDMTLASIIKHKIPAHVMINDILDSPSDIAELQQQIQMLKQKITDTTTLSLLQQWEQQQS